MKWWLFPLASACVLVSCIGTKEFTIRTLPEGAEIAINGEKQEGKTPMTLVISQEKDLGIVATKPGYEATAHTVYTQSSWFQALLWTKSDPRAQYISEDEVTIQMKKIPTPEGYRPSTIPEYTGGAGATAPGAVPALRAIPKDLL